MGRHNKQSNIRSLMHDIKQSYNSRVLDKDTDDVVRGMGKKQKNNGKRKNHEDW